MNASVKHLAAMVALHCKSRKQQHSTALLALKPQETVLVCLTGILALRAGCVLALCPCLLTVCAGSKLEDGKVPEDDPYHKFAAVTKALGFRGLLGEHR